MRLIFDSFEPYPYSYPYPIILTLKLYESVVLKVVQLLPVLSLFPSSLWLKSVSDFAHPIYTYIIYMCISYILYIHIYYARKYGCIYVIYICIYIYIYIYIEREREREREREIQIQKTIQLVQRCAKCNKSKYQNLRKSMLPENIVAITKIPNINTDKSQQACSVFH